MKQINNRMLKCHFDAISITKNKLNDKLINQIYYKISESVWIPYNQAWRGILDFETFRKLNSGNP